jgi:hypothetical protein
MRRTPALFALLTLSLLLCIALPTHAKRTSSPSATPARLQLMPLDTGWVASPLQELRATLPPGTRLEVLDSRGRGYFTSAAPASGSLAFRAGGALGQQRLRLRDAAGALMDSLTFTLRTRTDVNDNGRFRELFSILDNTMRGRRGGAGRVMWRDTAYPCFVSWMLDHSHVAKGMQYFSLATSGMVDLMSKAQRSDGMIWSFAQRAERPSYYQSAYGDDGYAWYDSGTSFVRQPVENHPEYNFVDAMYLAWKGSGNNAWMQSRLASAMRALDYSMSDSARWSTRFGLLKRAYTIDSWDFQVDDARSPEHLQGAGQRIDLKKTKFGVFYGDNTGYAYACEQLADMLTHAGRPQDAARYAERDRQVRQRLDALAWNGRFYTHRIEEDSSVHWDLGVDEKSQISLSNAYSLNRNIGHEHSVAIIQTYLDLKAHLPAGSPGEWYAIYPPFERGFGPPSEKWQYMNGGVHGHVAGELARGAFANGFESYGADILERIRVLGKRFENTVRFAYTGAIEVPDTTRTFTPVPLAAVATMDLGDKGGPGVPRWMEGQPGNDLADLPTGEQHFAGVPFSIADPARNGRRSAVAVRMYSATLPQRVVVPVNRTAGSLYLLNTAKETGPSNVGGCLTLTYGDGTRYETYLLVNTHYCNWWYPVLRNRRAGIAWRGSNKVTNDVGVSWCVIDNPFPAKKIKNVTVSAAQEGATYALLALTLADKPWYTVPDPLSSGGPDNWAGATCMAALIEGLAGAGNLSTAFDSTAISPRWMAAGVDSVSVSVHYPASDGYVAYRYRHDTAERRISVLLTGSGTSAVLRVLLPVGVTAVKAATLNAAPLSASVESVESSHYAVLPVRLGQVSEALVEY